MKLILFLILSFLLVPILIITLIRICRDLIDYFYKRSAQKKLKQEIKLKDKQEFDLYQKCVDELNDIAYLKDWYIQETKNFLIACKPFEKDFYKSHLLFYHTLEYPHNRRYIYFVTGRCKQYMLNDKYKTFNPIELDRFLLSVIGPICSKYNISILEVIIL